MFAEISEALLKGLDGNMTCTFPDFIKDIRGKDANYEFASSSTLPPLRLEYTYNIVTETRGLVFVNTHLIGFEVRKYNLTGFKDIWSGTEDGRYDGQRYTAEQMGERIKNQLIDSGTVTKDVKVCVNYSKAQIIAEFQATKTLAKDLKETKGIDLGVFVINVGFEINESKLKSLGAPLSVEGIAHHYMVTVEGEPVCLNHLCIDLTNDSTTTATLINQFDYDMREMAKNITIDHLKKDADGAVDWLPFEL